MCNKAVDISPECYETIEETIDKIVLFVLFYL